MNLPLSAKEEPPTSAKVVLFTSHGELQIELWTREAPLACRNFIQHCFNDYYKDTFFHRLIPGFMIQGGDPTGTGNGGQSIFGAPFRDEFHQRLHFNRRGIVAMANSGKDSNASQFFLTFGDCQHLYKKHTIFGKIVGDTIYNLMAIQSLDTDKDDRPIDPPFIRKTRVLLNPFDDIVPAVKTQAAAPQIAQPSQAQQKQRKRVQLQKFKKKSRLSFDCDQFQQNDCKVKSSHDSLHEQKLSNKVAVDTQSLVAKLKEKKEDEKKKRQIKDRILGGQGDQMGNLMDQELLKKRKLNEGTLPKVEDEILNYRTEFNVQTNRHQLVWQIQKEKQQKDKQDKLKQALEQQRRQREGIMADQLNFKKVKEGSHKLKRKMLINQEVQLLSNAERIRYQFLKKQQQQNTDTSLFEKLNGFTSKLTGGIPANNKNWMKHNLKFHIDSQAAYKLDEKKRILHTDQGDLEDGGLKIEVEYNQQIGKQFNVDELYDMIHNQAGAEQEGQSS